MINVGCHSRLSGILLKDKERFWTSQNDKIKDLRRITRSLEIHSINKRSVIWIN